MRRLADVVSETSVIQAQESNQRLIPVDLYLAGCWSPALRVTAAFGISGVAFTLGNLLLARVLPASEYGVFALVTGLLSISTAAAPMGIDQVVNRRHLAFTPALWRRVVGASAVAAAIAVVVAGLVYRLNPPLLLALATGTFGGGITAVAAAYFQSKQRFQTSVPMLQAPNLATLGAAILAEDLATFGVVSSLVASPFRMLHNAVFYTIIPRLRGARSKSAGGS